MGGGEVMRLASGVYVRSSLCLAFYCIASYRMAFKLRQDMLYQMVSCCIILSEQFDAVFGGPLCRSR